MKRRIIALALTAILALTGSALAAPEETGFVRVKTYEGQFSDLAGDSVFYDNVAALYEYGLSVGRADGTYGLTDSMTLGEVVIFAGRIRSLYVTGDPEEGPAAYGGGGPLAGRYLRYLRAEGVLDEEYEPESLGVPAARAEVAHVLANVLPQEELPLINDTAVTTGYATRTRITDVTEYTPYYQDILYLYRTGISAGGDETGTFQPDAPITRGAAAAMLTRVIDPSLRITLDWRTTSGGASAQGITLADLVPEGYYVPAPYREQDMEACVQYMLSSGSDLLEFTYPDGLDADQARNTMNMALRIVKSYCEQGYNSVSCNYTHGGYMSLHFSAVGQESRLAEYREYSINAAVEVHDCLWKEGRLTAEMSEYEKAEVYFDWICDNCVYDYSAGSGSVSHTPYSLFANGSAVCDGYTGAYNMLLKLEGISCSALANDSHIWTVAILDGEEVHIDTTWGDSGSRVDYSYFAMTEAESYRRHPW